MKEKKTRENHGDTLLKEKETLYNHGDTLDFKDYIIFFKFLKLSHHVALPGLELVI